MENENNIPEKVIDAVAGDMAIEGMDLTAADKQRIREYAFYKEKIGGVVSQLVKKHTVSTNI